MASCIVLAAGKSTRIRSKKSKLLHEVAGIPVITRVTRAAAEAGADPVVVVTSPDGDDVFEAARQGAPDCVRAIQDPPRGTGDAVRVGLDALDATDGQVLILAGDVPLITPHTLKKLLEPVADRYVCALLTMYPPDPHGYGRIIRGVKGVRKILEQADIRGQEESIPEVNAGIYAFDLPWLREEIGKLRESDSGEIYLTDLVERAAERAPVPGIPASFREVMGVNTRRHLADAIREANRRNARAWMERGAGILFPDEVEIDDSVSLDRDCVIERGVVLRGATSVGEDAVVGHGSIVIDSVIEPGAVVKPYSVIEHSVVRAEAQVGPFAHLRPESDIGPKAKVGNFVETKKAKLGPGVKASHLSYLGDVQVGEGSNIGAGTITCNYDGKHKHRTIIGERVFIGSDSQLVAPVTVEHDAYVGSGTTVLKDVPPYALAINPKKQRNIEDWAKKD